MDWFCISGPGLGNVLRESHCGQANLCLWAGCADSNRLQNATVLALFLAVAIWQARKASRGELPKLDGKQRLQMVFLGFIGYYLASLLDFIGLQYITAGLERLILFLSPTFVLLFSALFLKKRILPKQWLALALAYLGVSLVFVQDLSLSGQNVLLGAACVLGSALSYAFYLIGSGELLKRIGATRLVAYAMCTSAIYTLIHFFYVNGWHGLQQPAAVYGLSLIHAVFNTVAPTFMIMWSVERIGAPMTSQLGLLGPVSILFLANWFLGEPITPLQIAGTILVLTGAMVLSRR